MTGGNLGQERVAAGWCLTALAGVPVGPYNRLSISKTGCEGALGQLRYGAPRAAFGVNRATCPESRRSPIPRRTGSPIPSLHLSCKVLKYESTHRRAGDTPGAGA